MKGLFQCPPWARSFCPFRAYGAKFAKLLHLIIYSTPQPRNKEVGIFPHPFRGNPTRENEKHRIFAPEKRNMKYNN